MTSRRAYYSRGLIFPAQSESALAAKQTVADTNVFFALCTCAVTFTRHPEGFEVRFLKHTVGVDPDIEL